MNNRTSRLPFSPTVFGVVNLALYVAILAGVSWYAFTTISTVNSTASGITTTTTTYNFYLKQAVASSTSTNLGGTGGTSSSSTTSTYSSLDANSNTLCVSSGNLATGLAVAALILQLVVVVIATYAKGGASGKCSNSYIYGVPLFLASILICVAVGKFQNDTNCAKKFYDSAVSQSNSITNSGSALSSMTTTIAISAAPVLTAIIVVFSLFQVAAVQIIRRRMAAPLAAPLSSPPPQTFYQEQIKAPSAPGFGAPANTWGSSGSLNQPYGAPAYGQPAAPAYAINQPYPPPAGGPPNVYAAGPNPAPPPTYRFNSDDEYGKL